MDLKKNGRFLSEIRKEEGLTQKQLAEQIGVSDKTISKWECGHGFPDVSMMMPLCQTLHISINELVSGERISANEYLEKAEVNMMNLIQDKENQRKSIIREIISGIVWLAGIAVFVVLMLCVVENGFVANNLTYYLDLVGIMEVVFVMLFALGFAGRLKDFRNGFAYLFHGAENSEQLTNSIAAVALAEKSLILGGTFCTVFYGIYIMQVGDAFNDLNILAGNIGVTLLTLLYGVLGAVILAAVKSRLEKMNKRMR